MADDEYEGWRNRSTWAIALWFNNDEGLYYMARDWFEQCADEGMPYAQAVEEVANDIRDFVQEEYAEAVDRINAIIVDGFLTNPQDVYIDYDKIAMRFVGRSDYEDFASESLRSAYNKAKDGAKKGVQKAKSGASNAKAKVQSKARKPAAKNVPKSASKRKAPAKKPATKRRC